jgi:hypothetical protein
MQKRIGSSSPRFTRIYTAAIGVPFYFRFIPAPLPQNGVALPDRLKLPVFGRK